MREDRLAADLTSVTLTQLVRALVKPDTVVVGLGPWSDRVKISMRDARQCTAEQILYDVRNTSGKFWFSLRENAVRIGPASSGERVFLEEARVTVELLDDKRTVRATDALGNVLWENDVIAACYPHVDPWRLEWDEELRVWRLFFDDEKVIVSFDRRAEATIDLRTGVVKYWGSD